MTTNATFLHRYHDTPNVSWRSSPVSGEGLLGLEIECSGRRLENLERLVNFGMTEEERVILEEDSSIAGAEVITPPLPMEYVLRGGYLEKLLGNIEQAGWDEEVGTSYGLHINLDVSSWDKIEAMVTLMLLRTTGLFPDLDKKLLDLAGRNPTRYCQKRPYKMFELTASYDRQLVALIGHPYDKYGAARFRQRWNMDAGSPLVMEYRSPISIVNKDHISRNVEAVLETRDVVRTEGVSKILSKLCPRASKVLSPPAICQHISESTMIAVA